MMDLPDLQSLRCFAAVAQMRNFRRAAASVGLSPPAFSERIRRLEEDFGVPLLKRTTRQVQLSEEGHRLILFAEELLEKARQCKRIVQEEAEELPLELRIGTRYELGIDWLVPALSRLEKEQPRRKLHLVFGDSPELLQKMRGQQIDAVITSFRLGEGEWTTHPLHPESYSFVGSAAYLEEIPFRRAQDAKRHQLLDVHGDLPLFRYFRDAQPAQEEWMFSEYHYLGTIAAIAQRVMAGKGIAVLPTYLIREELSAGDLRCILPRRPLADDFFRLVHNRRHPLAEAMQGLATELSQIELP